MQISTVIAVLRVCVCVMKLKPPKESDAAPRNLRYKDERSKTATWANSSYNQDSLRWSGSQMVRFHALNDSLSCRVLYIFTIGTNAPPRAKAAGKWGPSLLSAWSQTPARRRLDRNCASATSHIPAFEPAASNTCTHPRVLPLRAGI